MGGIDNTQPFLTPLKIIEQAQGGVMHGIKASDHSFAGFGEAYFSTVNFGLIKGWKLHRKMTLNLVVPSGEIRFVVHSASENYTGRDVVPVLDVILGSTQYSRLTVPPGYWVAFEGVGRERNILLNVADIEHEPSEAINYPLDFFRVPNFHQF